MENQENNLNETSTQGVNTSFENGSDNFGRTGASQDQRRAPYVRAYVNKSKMTDFGKRMMGCSTARELDDYLCNSVENCSGLAEDRVIVIYRVETVNMPNGGKLIQVDLGKSTDPTTSFNNTVHLATRYFAENYQKDIEQMQVSNVKQTVETISQVHFNDLNFGTILQLFPLLDVFTGRMGYSLKAEAIIVTGLFSLTTQVLYERSDLTRVNADVDFPRITTRADLLMKEPTIIATLSGVLGSFGSSKDSPTVKLGTGQGSSGQVGTGDSGVRFNFNN